MSRFLFVGDTHGQLDFVTAAAQHARQLNADLIQCGDWGFIWPGKTKLSALSAMLVAMGVTMRFIDGNHDAHPALRRLCKDQHKHGVEIAPRVIYQPRGSTHEDKDGTRFLFCGGAPSIDREGRIEGKSWWPEETLTEAEFELTLAATSPIHVLVTHDAPDFPPGFSAKGSLRYQALQALSMQRIDALIKKHRPPMHVHGHWHTRATTYRGTTRVEALNCNQLDPTFLDESVLLWTQESSHRD